MALDFLRGGREKTLGQASIHSFYGASTTSLFLVRWLRYHRLLLNYLMIGADKSKQNNFSIIICNYWLLAHNHLLLIIFVLTCLLT
jgi:hypothetical protein